MGFVLAFIGLAALIGLYVESYLDEQSWEEQQKLLDEWTEEYLKGKRNDDH